MCLDSTHWEFQSAVIIVVVGNGDLMAKNSLWTRLSKALREEAPETTDDIDRDLESVVQAIKEAEVETVDANNVLGGGWGSAGDMVYIMDMAPSTPSSGRARSGWHRQPN